MRYFVLIVIFTLVSIGGYAQEAKQFVYDSREKRDPFVPLIGDITRGVGNASQIMSIEDVDFQGAASDAKGRMIAIMNGEIFRRGDSSGEMVVKAVGNDNVTVVIKGKEHTLILYDD